MSGRSIPAILGKGCRFLVEVGSLPSRIYLVPIGLCCVLQLCGKSLQSCLTLSDPMDCSLPGSSVHVILQGRILEWDFGAYHLSKNVLGPARVLSGGKHAPCLSLPALEQDNTGRTLLKKRHRGTVTAHSRDTSSSFFIYWTQYRVQTGRETFNTETYPWRQQETFAPLA